MSAVAAAQPTGPNGSVRSTSRSRSMTSSARRKSDFRLAICLGRGLSPNLPKAGCPAICARPIVPSVRLRFIKIDEPRLRQRLAHIVHVEPERAGGELLAFGLLVGMTLFSLGRALPGIFPWPHHDALV